MPLEAINHLHDYGSGDTHPQLFECRNDGARERWVLKLMGRANAELAADWIGSLLAHRLQLPCPEVRIANVSTGAFETLPPHLRHSAQPGPAFASREVSPASPIDSTAALLDAIDGELLARLYVLDRWLEVLDRYRPDGSWNLLRQPAGLAVIDFGKALSSCFVRLLGPPSGNPVGRYPNSVTIQFPTDVIAQTCANIRATSDDELAALVASVPPQWLSAEQKTCALALLLERRGRIEALCEQDLGG